MAFVPILSHSPGKRLRYLLRDRFTTEDASAPLGTPRTAEPGPGTATITDVESQNKILSGRLRGLYQPTTPVWGDNELVWGSLSRAQGRTLIAVAGVDDENGDLALGWATSDPGDPRTNGHGLLLGENARYKLITPGVKVDLLGGSRSMRSMQYLAVVVLNAEGACYLLSTFGDDSGAQGASPDQIGIPQYPQARLLWVELSDATASLLPYISGLDSVPGPYPNGHAIEDFRVLDIREWAAADALASFIDRFNRSDSTSTMGLAWTPISGVWGISGNKAYNVSGSGFRTTWTPTGSNGDGLYSWTITLTTVATDSFRLTLRHDPADRDDFMCLNSNGTATTLALQKWLDNAFSSTIDNFTLPTTLVASSTHTFTLIVKGNRYLCLQNGLACNAGAWATDAGNNFLTADGIGIGVANANPSVFRFENVGVFPNIVDLPVRVFARGAKPRVYSGGATLGSDTFTDSNGTSLDAHTAEAGPSWTEQNGTWEIQSNRAALTVPSASQGGNNYATQELGRSDVEVEVDVITPGTFPTTTVRCGLMLRWVDASNHLFVRLYYDGTGEVELTETVGGAGLVVKKSTIQAITVSTTYRLKAQCVGDLVQVFLDGKPRLSYVLRAANAGTRFGLYRLNTDDGCVLDNWSAKAA